jgi:hypothetical protein
MIIAQPRSFRFPLYQIAEENNDIVMLRAEVIRVSALASFCASGVVGAGNSREVRRGPGVRSPLTPIKNGIAPNKPAALGNNCERDVREDIIC